MILGRVHRSTLTNIAVIQTLVIRTRWLSLKQRPPESPPFGPPLTHLSTVTRRSQSSVSVKHGRLEPLPPLHPHRHARATVFVPLQLLNRTRPHDPRPSSRGPLSYHCSRNCGPGGPRSLHRGPHPHKGLINIETDLCIQIGGACWAWGLANLHVLTRPIRLFRRKGIVGTFLSKVEGRSNSY